MLAAFYLKFPVSFFSISAIAYFILFLQIGMLKDSVAFQEAVDLGADIKSECLKPIRLLKKKKKKKRKLIPKQAKVLWTLETQKTTIVL